ncbi:hypothetical protein [uncultured Dokdonia sp.]|uniref:hypothetical protein n=1 Tax=uncultured Dokdonia sp. TaxID=575653 RepID=UPI002633BEB0|nr:hypothetical protein [uncultured Dokdonia sp.]
MSKVFLDENYKGIDYTINGLPSGEYDNCTFTNCLFPALHISNSSFLECEFVDCNFTNTAPPIGTYIEMNKFISEISNSI